MFATPLETNILDLWEEGGGEEERGRERTRCAVGERALLPTAGLTCQTREAGNGLLLYSGAPTGKGCRPGEHAADEHSESPQVDRLVVVAPLEHLGRVVRRSVRCVSKGVEAVAGEKEDWNKNKQAPTTPRSVQPTPPHTPHLPTPHPLPPLARGTRGFHRACTPARRSSSRTESRRAAPALPRS